MDNHEILEIMMSAERTAGELILHAGKILAENKTDRRNVVTEYDRKVQETLCRIITEKIPEAAFFCEESDNTAGVKGKYVFIIDPIDGTMNFVKGFHRSCVSVACMSEGTIVAGAVYNPYLQEMFSAIKGEGAFLNGAGLKLEDAPLSDSIVCFGSSPYRPDLSELSFHFAKALFDNSLDIRREGVAELDLCSVAAGRAGLYFELDTSFWDFAAGMLIVTEAGGVVRTADGGNLPLNGEKTSIVAGAPSAAQDYLRMKEKMKLSALNIHG